MNRKIQNSFETGTYYGLKLFFQCSKLFRTHTGALQQFNLTRRNCFNWTPPPSSIRVCHFLPFVISTLPTCCNNEEISCPGLPQPCHLSPSPLSTAHPCPRTGRFWKHVTSGEMLIPWHNNCRGLMSRGPGSPSCFAVFSDKAPLVWYLPRPSRSIIGGC